MSIKSTNGVLIASGFSKRMGELKPLLLNEGIPFLINITDKMLAVCDQVNIVLGYKHEIIIDETNKFLENSECTKLLSIPPDDILKRINFIYNEDYESGMFTSLLVGLNKTKNCDWVLYHFVDQPNIPLSFYQEFTDQKDKLYNWIQPEYRDRKGHPIIFSKTLCDKLLEYTSADNLKSISQKEFVRKKLWECQYPQVVQDIDTPDDYKNLITNS